jgi:hypothetical protein
MAGRDAEELKVGDGLVLAMAEEEVVGAEWSEERQSRVS